MLDQKLDPMLATILCCYIYFKSVLNAIQLYLDAFFHPQFCIQFIDVGAALLERPLVKPELTPKLDKLLDMLEAELDTVEVRNCRGVQKQPVKSHTPHSLQSVSEKKSFDTKAFCARQ